MLLQKLSKLGATNGAIRFFASYLQNRECCVSFLKFTSSLFMPNSGIPQGSKLGPLFFLIFINDLPEIFQSFCLLYADDVKLYRRINDISDTIILQNDLNRFNDWCILNELTLNINKCNVMSISRRKSERLSKYFIGLCELKSVEQIHDLGVIMNKKFNFNNHIDNVLTSCYKMMGFIKRSTKFFKDPKGILILYFSFVRSKIEYCSVIWNPLNKNYCKKIEVMQNNFLRYFYYKKKGMFCPRDFPTQRLRDLAGVSTLEDRRNDCLLITLYKICNGVIDSPDLLNLVNFQVPRSDSVRRFNLFYLSNPTVLASPISRACRLFDQTPDRDMFGISLNNFKNT